MSNSILNDARSEKPLNQPVNQYQKYKDFSWQKPEIFKNGPVDDDARSCRDILCLIIFFVFIGGCIVIAIIGFKEGNPNLILYPYDEDGNQCGINKLKDYQYIYFYDSINNIKHFNDTGIANSICVSACPNETLQEGAINTAVDCFPTANNPNCKITKENYYIAKGVVDCFCLPTTNIKSNSSLTDDVISSVNQLFNTAFGNTNQLLLWMGDLYNTWLAIFASLAWSFIIALLFLVIVRFCAGVMIYSTILLVLGGLIALGVFFHRKSTEYSFGHDTLLQTTMFALAIICYVLSGLWLLYIIFMCNRIRLAVGLLKATAKYIGQNFCIVFVPLVFLVIIGFYFAYWIILSIFLYSIGEVNKQSSMIATIQLSSKARYAWWFHLFSLLYVNELIRASSEFVYASSACIWYFTHEKKTKEGLIKKSFKRLFRYHFGSLCFGAFIMAVVKLIMFFMNFIKKRIDNTLGSNRKIAKCYKCLICCCQCCLNCISRTIEYVNRHAYIQIALKGDSFCVSAWEGFGLIIRNLGRFSALHLIGGFFNLFGIVFISVTSGVIGYFFITEITYFSSQLNSPVIPTIVMALIGLVIGMISMTVFGTSADALMHSFLLDEEINKGLPKSFPELQTFMAKER